MPYVSSRGNPSSRIWFILQRPYPSDIPKGFLFSGGMGHVFDKMLSEAGISPNDVYVVCRNPDTDTPQGTGSVDSSLQHHKPPFIGVFNEVGIHYLKEMRLKDEEDSFKSPLQKYVGSLLSSPNLPFPHYMMPLYGPDRAVQDWTERNITTYVDLQKLRDEYLFWKSTGNLQPLPRRTLVYRDLELPELLSHLDRFRGASLLSNDIETVYPKADTAYTGHPGYPITIGLADSPDFGISFNLFREHPHENRILWRTLAEIYATVPLLGQNFFNFDWFFQSAIGLEIPLPTIKDTLIRHHILWPELPHKLQFLTRQYTREPYYKDEGKHWNLKDMSSLRRYNCLDVCVTYEVYQEQEKEFDERPHLR